MDIVDHFNALVECFQKDDDFAWVWHCNIAVPIMNNTGVSHESANRIAADIMQLLFKVDTSQLSYFKKFEEKWEEQKKGNE